MERWSAIAAASSIITVAVLALAYVAGYFATTYMEGSSRLFRSELHYQLFRPMVAAEGWATGKEVTYGYNAAP
jgi:hypothetical protein